VSIKMLTVATSRDMSKPKMSRLLRAFVISLVSCSAGSAGRFSMVVRPSASCLLYSVYANLVFVELFTASLICDGVRPAFPTLQFFSMERIISLLCLACGVEGADGACWGWLFTPGPLVLFLISKNNTRRLVRPVHLAHLAHITSIENPDATTSFAHSGRTWRNTVCS